MTDMQTKDPVLAVLLNEIKHIREDQKIHRNETRDSMVELRKEVKENREFFTKEMAEVKSDVSKVKEFTTKWRGGYIALAGLGALVAWGLSGVGNLFRIFN